MTGNSSGYLVAALLCLALPFAAASSASAAGENDPILGSWEGSFECDSTEATFTLTLEEGEGVLLEGTFRFDFPGGDGAYRIRGRYLPQKRSFNLAPDDWIERPSGWRAAGMAGTVHDNGLTIDGTLRGCGSDGQSSRFSAQRGDVTSTKGGMLTVEADQPVPRTGGPFEGQWAGSIHCRKPSKEFPLTLDMLQDGDNVVARYIMSAENRGELIGIMSGQVSDGEAILELGSHQVIRTGFNIDKLRIAPADGRAVAVTLEVGMPAGWDCQIQPMRHAGTSNVAPAQRVSELLGTWSGFKLVKFIRKPELGDLRFSPEQARIVIAEEAGKVYGLLSLASPLTSPPHQQERYATSIHPLFETKDGQIVFVPTRQLRAEGSYGNWRDVEEEYGPNPFLLILSLDSDGTLLADGKGIKPFQLLRASPEQVDRLNIGEGPPAPLPPAISGHLAAAPSLDEQCRVLRDWAEPVTEPLDLAHMTRTEAIEAILPLFRDKRFEPVFGLPYSFMAESERLAIQNMMDRRFCSRRIGLDPHFFGSGFEYAFGYDDDFDEIVGMLADRQETGRWHEAAVAEIDGLPVKSGSRRRLAELETEAAARADEISERDRAAFDEVVADKRHAIAVAEINERAAHLPSLPETLDTLDKLKALVADASAVGLPADDAAALEDAARDKAEAIVLPAVARAITQAKRQPISLAALAEVTRHYRNTLGLFDRLGQQLRIDEAEQGIATLRAIRERLINSSKVQDRFRQAMADVTSGGDPTVAVQRQALRYIDKRNFSGPTAIPAYADAVESAVRTLEIRSIKFADRSTTSAEGEPTAEEMLLAVKSSFDRLNDQLLSLHRRCEARQFQNDPLMAMQCLTVLASGMSKARLTRFEKIGCANAVVRSGYVCDYVIAFKTDSQFMQGRLGELLGSGSAGKGRFVRTSGGWLFTRLH